MNTLLLVIAIMLTSVLFIPLLLVQSIRNRKRLGEYHYNLALNIDYMWGSLLFGEDGHTVSSEVYKRAKKGKRKYLVFMKIINFMFANDVHCLQSFIKEYGGKDA